MLLLRRVLLLGVPFQLTTTRTRVTESQTAVKQTRKWYLCSTEQRATARESYSVRDALIK